MRPKPAGLEPSYAAQFNDPSVVAAYGSRPPYPDRLVSLVLDLAGRSSGSILDLGCGTGELARRLAPGVRSITAIDHAERMIDRARQLPGGNATNVKWIVGRVEDVSQKRSILKILISPAVSAHMRAMRVKFAGSADTALGRTKV